VNVRLFPARRLLPAGFSGLIAPGLGLYLRRHYSEYDAFHFQLARDLITLPAALFLSRKSANFVVQPHGMIQPDKRWKARLFDLVAVRRVLGSASAVIAYKNVDDEALQEVARGDATIRFLENGVSLDPLQIRKSPASAEVLFMARLHPRKRVLAFAEMARILKDRGVPASYVVIGPDEGDLAELTEYIKSNGMSDDITYEGSVSYDKVRDRLRVASVYVLPSVNEPFPVTVLESMAVGTPAVITDSCGLAIYFERDSAGEVNDGTPEAMAASVHRLLTDMDYYELTAQNARQTILDSFSIRAVVSTLLNYYKMRSSA
jgi:glycosyltransferase involved in cell wall biosynthesis